MSNSLTLRYQAAQVVNCHKLVPVMSSRRHKSKNVLCCHDSCGIRQSCLVDCCNYQWTSWLEHQIQTVTNDATILLMVTKWFSPVQRERLQIKRLEFRVKVYPFVQSQPKYLPFDLLMSGPKTYSQAMMTALPRMKPHKKFTHKSCNYLDLFSTQISPKTCSNYY